MLDDGSLDTIFRQARTHNGFTGSISDAQLRALYDLLKMGPTTMNTQPARWFPWPRSGAFVRAVFDEDLRRIWFFYRAQAFASAEIVDAPIDVDLLVFFRFRVVSISLGISELIAIQIRLRQAGQPPLADWPLVNVVP